MTTTLRAIAKKTHKVVNSLRWAINPKPPFVKAIIGTKVKHVRDWHLIPKNSLTSRIRESIEYNENIELPILEEIESVIKRQKKYKVTGLVGISAEIIKSGGLIIMKAIHNLVPSIWN